MGTQNLNLNRWQKRTQDSSSRTLQLVCLIVGISYANQTRGYFRSYFRVALTWICKLFSLLMTPILVENTALLLSNGIGYMIKADKAGVISIDVSCMYRQKFLPVIADAF